MADIDGYDLDACDASGIDDGRIERWPVDR